MVVNWNPLVNTNLCLDGEYSAEDNRISIKFDSGKERFLVRNSYAPMVFPSLSLELDNTKRIAIDNENTELKQFKQWLFEDLRHGTLPFYAPRIMYKYQTGIYEFISMPEYDETDGTVIATFGLRELGFFDHTLFLATNLGQYIITNTGHYITIKPERGKNENNNY